MKRGLKLLVSLSIVIFTIGCGGDSTEDLIENSTSSVEVNLPTSFKPDDGRLLASNCYGCHGTNGFSQSDWDSIAGEDELHEEMFESGGIMLAQAKGYSDSEIAKMEEFLKSLPEAKESEGDEDEEEDDD